ncbi:UNVERIFIED_CONTAM: hypothetical protein HDU68_009105 [Siphonaria sp. JEL0065]|nr:hypothetical protein HDU68_009105 [Siphonaria sp. JEL0065]
MSGQPTFRPHMTQAQLQQMQKRKRPLDRNLPLRIESFVPEARLYVALQNTERRLDAAHNSKRAALQESLMNPPKTKATLRLWVENTAAYQSPTTADDAPPAEWSLKVHGVLVMEDGKEKKAKLSSLLRAIQVKILRDQSLFVEPNTVEWRKGDSQIKDFDGFEVTRKGDQEVQVRISLVLDQDPELYKISPDLASVLGVEKDSRTSAILRLWQYIKMHGLQDIEDKRQINFDEALQKIFKTKKVLLTHLPDLLSAHFAPLDAITIDYTVKLDKPHAAPSTAYEVEVEDDSLVKAHILNIVGGGEVVSRQEIAVIDDEITRLVQKVTQAKHKREFMLSFAKDPVGFLTQSVASQTRDLEVVLVGCRNLRFHSTSEKKQRVGKNSPDTKDMTPTERSPLLPRTQAVLTPTGLHRGLKARHLIMMSVGGTIGTGLFVASGLSIANAGPGGALAAYSLVGLMVFCVLTSLGEMAALIPVSGSFHEFAGRFVDPALAWTLGWNYWLQWSISLTSEITAAGILMTYWFPATPAWMFSAMILSALVFINTRSVAMFGETEYWLSFVKVFTVLAFVGVGAYVDVNGFGDGNPPIGFSNWWIEGAPFKNGFSGFFSVISIAFFAFGGTELVGISAGEVENPRRNVPIAINQSFWRIFGFYISSIGLIGLLIPNDDPSLSLSAKAGDVSIAPFTLILQRAGLLSAATVMNIVILSAVISTANSAMYAASRTLMALSVRGQAPPLFSLTSSNGVPVWALFVTVLIGSTAFLGIVLGEGELFNLLLSLTGTSGLLTWLSISLTHLRFRAALEAQEKSLEILPYTAPLFPFMDYLAISIGLVILMGQAFSAVFGPVLDVGALLSLFVGVPLFFGLYLGYRWWNGVGLVDLMDCDLSGGVGGLLD